MTLEKVKLDKIKVIRNTSLANMRIKKTEELSDSYVFDYEKDTRCKENKCVVCYYTPQVVTQAFTKRPCSICDLEIVHSNGNCPVLCHSCAEDHKLCHQCGADSELRNLRRKFDF